MQRPDADVHGVRGVKIAQLNCETGHGRRGCILMVSARPVCVEIKLNLSYLGGGVWAYRLWFSNVRLQVGVESAMLALNTQSYASIPPRFTFLPLTVIAMSIHVAWFAVLPAPLGNERLPCVPARSFDLYKRRTAM